MSSLTDWVAVTISPRWNNTVTSDAGLASIFSAKSGQRGAARKPQYLAVAARHLHATDRGGGHVVEFLTALLLLLRPRVGRPPRPAERASRACSAPAPAGTGTAAWTGTEATWRTAARCTTGGCATAAVTAARRYPRVGQLPARLGDRPGRRDAYPDRRVHRRGHPDPTGTAALASTGARRHHARIRTRTASAAGPLNYQVRRDATARRRVRYRAEAHLVAARRARCRRRQTGCCRPADRAAGPRAVARLTGAARQPEDVGAEVTGRTGGTSTVGLGAATTRGSGCGAGAGSGGARGLFGWGVGVSAGAAARAESAPAGAGPPELRPSTRHSSQTRRAR